MPVLDARTAPAAAARAIHGALFASPVIIAIVLWLVFRQREPLAALQGPVGLAVLGACGAGFALALLLRSRIPARRSTEEESAWWGRTLPRALALWAVLEGVAIVAIVTGLLGGQPFAAGAALMIYLALMTLSAPSRLRGDG